MFLVGRYIRSKILKEYATTSSGSFVHYLFLSLHLAFVWRGVWIKTTLSEIGDRQNLDC